MANSTRTFGCSFYSDTPLKHGATLYANSEFTGPPMLAAFFVTATISIVAVIFAYLSGAVGESSQNFVDERVVYYFQACWYKVFPQRRERQQSQASTITLGYTRDLRKEGVIQFILVLSDQQLVTGVAILLAALANLPQLNRYELIVAHSLAWFSATTHLATLDVLSQYLQSHRIVRSARNAGIVFFLILLSCCFVIRASNAMVGNEMQSPASCPFNATSPHLATYSNWHGTFNVAWQSSWTLALLLVLLSYLIRIQDLYVHQRHPFWIVGWFAWVMRAIGSRYVSYSQTFAENKAALRYQRILWVSGSNGQKRWMPFGYDDSFLSSIPGILFSFSYGISQLVSVRWGMNLTFIAQDHSWGFGQIVALLLLCLPFMAAGATISDYKRKRGQQFAYGLQELESGMSSISHSITSGTIDSNMSLRRPSHQYCSSQEDIDAVDIAYNQKLVRIQRYFSKRARLICEESKADALQLAQRKQSLLSDLEVVERFEEQISIVPHAVCFSLQACGALALGALLNAASFDSAGTEDQRGVWFAIAVMITFIGAKTISLTCEIVKIMRIEA